MKANFNTENIEQNKSLLFIIAFTIPFITLIVLFLLVAVVCVAPFFLLGFIIYLNKKNARKSRILQLAKNIQESKQKNV
jgi:heme/copper-type cytochrome/quinol oxidase subunit 2